MAAALAAIAGAAIAPATANADHSTALTPDLSPIRTAPDQMLVAPEGQQTLLRMSTEVANRGAGPLEVFPSAASRNCDGDGDPANDRDAAQRIFGDTNASGAYEPDADRALEEVRVGCLRYHATHDHWHLLDFARYELRRERSGRRVAAVRKVGFCLADYRLGYPMPGAPEGNVYPFGAAAQRGCDASATQGVSVGWIDSYPLSVPGQALNVTGLRRGRYCLITRIDPFGVLVEAAQFDNERRLRVALRPRQHSVRPLPGRCRI